MLRHENIKRMFRSSLVVIIIASITGTIGMLVDGILIGRYLGSDALAAYGLISPAFLILHAVGGVFSSGMQALCAGYMGKGKLREANGVFTLTTVLTIGISVIFAAGMALFADPIAAFLGAKTIEGAQKYGVIAAPKHIAFNDSEVNRTGVATFMTEQKAREGELRAMQASIEDAKALGAMTAYNRVGVYTDNAHPTLLKNIVRGEWGFQGLMSEDFIMDPSYVTLKEAVLNGVTMSCNTGESTMAAVSGYYPYWTLENVQNDPELTAALKQAMTWQAYALANSNAMDGYASSTRIEKVRTWYDNALTGVAIVFALLTLLNIVMYFKARKKED